VQQETLGHRGPRPTRSTGYANCSSPVPVGLSDDELREAENQPPHAALTGRACRRSHIDWVQADNGGPTCSTKRSPTWSVQKGGVQRIVTVLSAHGVHFSHQIKALDPSGRSPGHELPGAVRDFARARRSPGHSRTASRDCAPADDAPSLSGGRRSPAVQPRRRSGRPRDGSKSWSAPRPIRQTPVHVSLRVSAGTLPPPVRHEARALRHIAVSRRTPLSGQVGKRLQEVDRKEGC
jgi:hypothetical protein